MLRFSKSTIAVAFFVFAFAIIPAYGDSIISLASAGTAADAGQTNSNGATIAIDSNPLWASSLPGSSWVSYTTSGNPNDSNFVTVPNGTVVKFFDTFTLSGGASSAILQVLADDSATVILNGVDLMNEASTANNTYHTCSDFGIGCLQATTIDLPLNLLQAGSNTLEFDVAQRAGYSYGLDYIATIDDPPSTVAEPGSLILLMTGLLACAILGFTSKPTLEV